MAARIAELEDQAEQARLRAAKFEKDKMKLQVEIRDISMELETVNRTALCLLSLVLLPFVWLSLFSLTISTSPVSRKYSFELESALRIQISLKP